MHSNVDRRTVKKSLKDNTVTEQLGGNRSWLHLLAAFLYSSQLATPYVVGRTVQSVEL